jgi:hypothetical protein
MAAPRIAVNYRTTPWKERDQIVDAIQTVVEDEGLNANDVRAISGVAATTLGNWFSGKTKKPQNITVDAVSSSLGYVRNDEIDDRGMLHKGFRKVKRYDYLAEREKQADWMIKQGRALKKKVRRARKDKKKKGHNGGGSR